MNTLNKIMQQRRARIAQQMLTTPLADLQQACAKLKPPRDFVGAIKQKNSQQQIALIAEIKKASPSAGLIRADFVVPTLAQAYAAGGACCLSVLTEPDFFMGESSYILSAKAACALPVLRKDFIFCEWQIYESRILGADAVLLIMACLDDALALHLSQTAQSLGMAVLCEVHDTNELARAQNLPVEMLGINNRNLATLAVDVELASRLAPMVGGKKLVVGESGYQQQAQLLQAQKHGVHAFLVGESLMRQDNITNATKALIGGA